MSGKIPTRFDKQTGRFINQAARPAGVLSAEVEQARTAAAREAAQLDAQKKTELTRAQWHYVRQRAGPDPLQKLLSISEDAASDLTPFHTRDSVDRQGYPEWRTAVYRAFDGPNWLVEQALYDMTTQRRACYRRAYRFIQEYYSGVPQTVIAAREGITKQRVSAITRMGVRWLRDRLAVLRAGAQVGR